ncbi:MAG: beta-lactamase family protein [Planctomycetes bacterium]|nr:beta-lactamase family protein [Planctomycetota bacterium]
MMRTLRLSLLSLTITGLAGLFGVEALEAGKNATALDAKAIQAILEPIRQKHDVPGLAAAVVNNKGLVAMAADGVRKRGSHPKLGPDDLYHLGSDTKPITAWLIAWLIEMGKLDWDTTLEDIFPDLAMDFSDELKKVNVTQLLTHHSGMPANWLEVWLKLNKDKSPREQRQAMMGQLGQIKFAHKPGEKFLYSNLGYVIAGAIAEKVTDDSWENLLRKAVFDPLKVNHVGFGPVGKPGEIEQPWAHSAAGKPVPPTPFADNLPVMGPAGRVHISLPDWSLIIADTIRGVRGEKALLKPATYQKMMTTPYMDEFYVRGGWADKDKAPNGKLRLLHNGSNTMNYASALIIPEDNFGILVVCNQGGDAAKKACHEARDALKVKVTEAATSR